MFLQVCCALQVTPCCQLTGKFELPKLEWKLKQASESSLSVTLSVANQSDLFHIMKVTQKETSADMWHHWTGGETLKSDHM